MPTNKQTNTGANNLTGAAARGAADLAGPALQLASGAGLIRTAADTLKGAALDKLLGPTALLAGGLLGVVRAIKTIVDQSGILERGLKRIASIQQIEGKFETLLKSAEKATQRMRELYKFTASSPFDLSDVAEANRILEALTKGALSGARGMKLIGDSAAATGQPMAETAERIGKLYNALKSGRSLDQLMFRLQATGAVTDELAGRLEGAAQAGASFAEMWALVETQLRVSEGGMAAEMKTLKGLEQQLKNVSGVMEEAFGKPFVEAQAKAMQNTINATKNLTPLIGQIGEDLAPVLTLFRSVRNEIADATLATKGFAAALGTAWSIAKSFAVGAGGAALAAIAGEFLKVALGAKSFVSNLAASRKGVIDHSNALNEARKAQQLGAQASEAFAEGSFLSAGALAAQAAWAKVSGAALNVHRTAMATAVAQTGKFNLIQYVGAAAAQVFAGGLLVIRNAAISAARGLAAFAVANPIVAVGAAALAAGYAFKSWADDVAKTNKEYIDFIRTLEKSREEMRKTAAEAKNLDQWRDASAKNDAEQKRILETKAGLDQNDPDSKDKAAELDRTLVVAKRARAVLDAKLAGIGIGRDERQQISDIVAKRLANRDTNEEANMSTASDLKRDELLRRRIHRRTVESHIGMDTAEARVAPERFKDKPTELMRLSTKISALESAGQAVPYSFYERQSELNHLADSWQEKRGQLDQDKAELRNLIDANRMTLTGVAGNRLRDQRLAGNDARGARGASDGLALAQMREEYRKTGLPSGQADKDFALRMKSEAMANAPRIVTDSLQSIGGGGGSSGIDAMALAQRRTDIAQRSEALLQTIVANTARDPAGATLQ